MPSPLAASDTYKEQISQIVNTQNKIVNVLDYGADETGVADSKAAIDSAITAAGSYGAVYFPDGTYLVESTVTITNGGVKLYCNTPRSAIINFSPSASSSCVKFNLPQSLGAVENLWFLSSDTTYVKKAIEMIDGSDFHIEGVSIGIGGDLSGNNWWRDSTGESVGIAGYGREVVSIKKPRIFADKPIVFGQNPNHANLDVDQFHLQDTYLVCTTNVASAQIEILNDVHFWNFTIDGYNAWAKGRYGLHWNTTSNVTISSMVSLKNIRHEQGYTASGDGATIYINHVDYYLQQLRLDSIVCDSVAGMDGIYLRGIRDTLMDNVKYDGTGVALDIDASDIAGGTGHPETIQWHNCYWGTSGATASIGSGVQEIWSGSHYSASQTALPNSALYERTEAPSNQRIPYKEQGVYKYNHGRPVVHGIQTGSSDVDFVNATSKISCTSANVDFTSVKEGDYLYCSGTTSNNTTFIAAADGTADEVETTVAPTQETGQSAQVIHGVPLRHRGHFSSAAQMDISTYSAGQPSATRNNIASIAIGDTGFSATNMIMQAHTGAGSIDYTVVGAAITAPSGTADRVEIRVVGSPLMVINYTDYDLAFIAEIKYL